MGGDNGNNGATITVEVMDGALVFDAEMYLDAFEV